jgi:hypothetical protein
MGPLPTSTVGNKYLLVIGDYFTKCVHAFPNEKSRGGNLAKKLIENFITIFASRCKYILIRELTLNPIYLKHYVNIWT